MSKNKSVQQLIIDEEIDAALIYYPSNRRYLSGFTGSTGYILLTSSEKIFFADFRYIEQSERECTGYKIISIVDEKDVFAYMKEKNILKLGVEKDYMSLSLGENIHSLGRVKKLVSIDNIISQLRMIKDDDEITRINRACEITDMAFEYILTQIYEGMSELEIDLKLQDYMRKFPEVERMPEKFIVASGEHGSLPHGIAEQRKIKKGELITIDFGCNCNGYWSDVTRTICLGKASEKQKEIYSIVLNSQRAAIDFVKAGIKGRDVDAIARDIIDSAGYGKYFGHGLGHSFGLDMHESPRFAQNIMGDIFLRPNMVMTVEPGIYIPGWGGVRIEDDIIITETGCINLTKSCKELIEII